MPKRSRKRPSDPNELGAEIVREATDDEPATKSTKNPHAQALGRLGGKKGGKARAAKMTPAERTESARRAARARWSRAS